MQRYQVFVRCQELPSAHAEYTYTLNASGFHVAAGECIKRFRHEPHVARRRIASIELVVTILGPAPRRQEILVPLDDGAQGGV